MVRSGLACQDRCRLCFLKFGVVGCVSSSLGLSVVFPQIWGCWSGSVLYAPKGLATYLGGGDLVVRRLAGWAWDQLGFVSIGLVCNTLLL